MKKTLLIYWPAGGNVERVSKLISKQMENLDLKMVTELTPSTLADYDLIIAGGSTVGAEIWEEAMQNDRWAPFLLKMREKSVDLSGKCLALFGLGDQVLYPEHFVDSMAILRDEFSRFGVKVVGKWPAEGYKFTSSESLEGSYFIGLALDEDNEPEKTATRLASWLEQVKKEAGF